MRPRQITTVGLAIAGALLAGAGTAHAAGTPEQQCQAGRYKAAAQYAACHRKYLAKIFGGGGPFEQEKLSKCRDKYRDMYTKLQEKALASPAAETCDAPRYVDNGDGTVNDTLTGLQWEKKTADASVHDRNNFYTWSDPGDMNHADADGTAFTSFLATLNSGGCFLGHCDWRLPTVEELQTILLEPYPCGPGACIDATFGTTATDYYWASTTLATIPVNAWLVHFVTGEALNGPKNHSFYVRAVRDGL